MLKLGSATLEKIVDLDPFVLPFDLLLPGRDMSELAHDGSCPSTWWKFGCD